MKTDLGYYSIIQYCPDPSRKEAANVGVVLFCPDRQVLLVRTTTSNQRIRRFFGPLDIDQQQLNTLKLSIQRRLEADRADFRTLADLEKFVATRANAMRMTPPNELAIPAQEAADQVLDRLFERLVGPRSPRTTHLRDALVQRFGSATLAPFVQQQIRVTLPLVQQRIVVPYGFQNGRFHLIRPVRFSGLTETALSARTGKYIVEGEALYHTRHPVLGKLKQIVVGEFAEHQTKFARRVAKLFKQHKTKLYRLDQLDQLVAQIGVAGKVMQMKMPALE